MLLTIDIGNTNLTLGLYDGSNLVAHWRLATDHARMPDEYGLQFQGLLQNANRSPRDLTGICLASVVPQLTSRIVQACREYLDREPFVVDVGIKTGIKVRYDDPRAVGADRIADAVAVMFIYKGPACVIDFGTATTFNAITKDGEYLGGAITAGINLATEALFTHAAKLPRIDLQRPRLPPRRHRPGVGRGENGSAAGAVQPDRGCHLCRLRGSFGRWLSRPSRRLADRCDVRAGALVQLPLGDAGAPRWTAAAAAAARRAATGTAADDSRMTAM